MIEKFRDEFESYMEDVRLRTAAEPAEIQGAYASA
jgi:hypothetical protein